MARNGMCIRDDITVKIIFFPVVNFTQSTYDITVISEISDIYPEVPGSD